MTISLGDRLQYDATKTTASRVRKIGFGEGYENAVGDGINPTAEEWQVVTIPLRNSDVDTMESELAGLKGDSFLWTPPVLNHVEARYRLASEISRSFLEGDYSTLSFTLKRVYKP